MSKHKSSWGHRRDMKAMRKQRLKVKREKGLVTSKMLHKTNPRNPTKEVD